MLTTRGDKVEGWFRVYRQQYSADSIAAYTILLSREMPLSDRLVCVMVMYFLVALLARPGRPAGLLAAIVMMNLAC